MTTRTPYLASGPSLAASSPPLPGARFEAVARRAQQEVRPGLVLALLYACGLAVARAIDVTEDGPVMLLFGAAYSATVTVSALLRPRWYLPLVVAYLPFSKVYPLPVAGIAGANLTNLLLVLGPVAWLSSRFQGRPDLRAKLPDLLAVLFVAVASLSLLPAYAAGPGLGELVQTYRAWLAPVLFFFMARGLARDREDIRAVLQVMAWTTLLVAADTWRAGLERSSRGSIDAARVPGLMVQANSMGAFLAYYGVPLLAFAMNARPRRRALAYFASFAFAVRATLYTFSRGAYLALAAGAGTVLAFTSPVLLATAGGGGAVTLLAFPSLIPESVRERLADTTAERSVPSAFEGENATVSLDRSSAHRLVLWRGAAQMIADHPLTGVGLGRFQELIGYYTEYPLRRSDPHDAHNAFILLAAETGLPTLALLLLLFLAWSLIALKLRFRRRHPVDRGLALAFLGSLVAVVVSSLLGSRFSDEALVGWFWILAALVVVAGRLRDPFRPARRAA
ncbi:MAG TPA: O-antigen ligase family protein [Vicinamibacteria bacterium]|jgi:O-antigen ligase|nr:O-antigen ligase family protein [Vicinamibacteria bacterium]